jgi:hypothetical protein
VTAEAVYGIVAQLAAFLGFVALVLLALGVMRRI